MKLQEYIQGFLNKLANLKLAASKDPVQWVHGLVAFGAVNGAELLGAPWWAAAAGMAAIAGVIEFWFDATYEHQPFKANLLDFAVYLAGIAAAVGLHFAHL